MPDEGSEEESLSIGEMLLGSFFEERSKFVGALNVFSASSATDGVVETKHAIPKENHDNLTMLLDKW